MGVCIDVHFEGSSVTKENSTFLPHNFKMRGARLSPYVKVPSTRCVCMGF